MIKKIVSSLLIAASVIAVFPVGASAEWKKDNTGWWYVDGKSYYTGWKQINGAWYYFDKDGYMKTGWILDKAWWYYLQDNGTMTIGKITVKGKEYEFDSNGKWINNGLPKQAATISASTITLRNSASVPPSVEKMKGISNFSWFNENGNTYFKVEENIYIKGGWNIDGNVYIFDENGVLQRGEYTSASGKKYDLGNDGKVIKCISDESYTLSPQYALTTKSSSNNYEVKLDDSNMLDISDINSDDPAKDGVRINGALGNYLDKTKLKAKVQEKTLYCKTNQIVDLGIIKVNGINGEASLIPNLIIISQSSDENVAVSGISLSQEDGFYKNIHPSVIANKSGKTTITIDVNGTKTSFDVVVTE